MKRIPRNKKRAMLRALKALSDYIRERDNYTCISCGRNYSNDMRRDLVVDCGHLFSRRYKAILFNEKNTNAQCVRCNRYLSGNWDEYLKAFIKKYGTVEFRKLEAQKNDLVKYDILKLFEIELYFINKLNELQEE